MAWLCLILAGLEEVVATCAMKYIDGWKRKTPIAIVVIGFAVSISMLTYAMREIPPGVAYAVWAGVGSIGITILGVVWFKEKLNRGQMISLAILIISVITLKMTT